MTTGVSAYTDDSCADTSKINGSSITDYIGETIYLKFDDADIPSDGNTDGIVTSVDVPARPTAPTLAEGNITAADTSLSLVGTEGVTYAIFYPDNTSNEPNETFSCTQDGQIITFDNLTASTEYTIRARIPASNEQPNPHFHSQQSVTTTTTSAPLVRIGITATTTYSYTGEAINFQYETSVEGLGDFTITYYPSMADENYSTPLESAPIDAGSYRVNLTREADQTYSAVNMWFTIEIVSGSQEAPSNGPTANAQTTTSITLNNMSTEEKTVEYGYVQATGDDASAENVSVWSSNLTFDNLQPGTAYTFYARYTASGSFEASLASPGSVIATLPNKPTDPVATINYQEETLSLGNTTFEASTDEDFETIIGTDISTIIPSSEDSSLTIYVRVAAAGDIPASEAVEFTIPARPQAPENLTPTNETYAGENDGKISGVNDTMEYRKDGESTWTSCPEGGSIENLAPGTYYVRYKAKDGEGVTDKAFASDEKQVEIKAGIGRTYTLAVTAPTFESVRTGYTQPDAQPITITSTGNTAATISSVTLSGDVDAFTLNRTDGTTIAAGTTDNTSYTIQPVAGLSAGTYTATITVTYNDGATVTAQVSFTVEQPSTPSSPTYRVTIDDLLHGSISSNHTWASAGTKVTLTITPDDGYQLDALTITDRNGEPVDYTTNADGSITFTMPRSGVTVSATFSEGMPAPDPGEEWPFVDVSEGDWFYDPVAWAYEQGLMTGTSATMFEPNISTTRGMIVAILHRLEDSPVVNYLMTFDDVADGDWYAEAVRWAASEGIVAGYSDAQFGPNDPITREQMAAILYNYAEWKGCDVSARADLSGYSDQPSAWAVEVMQWAKAEGLINGTTATTLDPQGHATRAQVAAILQRFLEN